MDADAIKLATDAADPILGQIVVNLVSDACSLTLQRAFRAARDKHRRDRGAGDLLTAFHKTSGDPELSLAGVAQLDFSTTTATEIREALSDPNARTIARQVAAATLIGETDEVRDDVLRLLTAHLRARGANVSDTEVNSLLSYMFDVASARFASTRSTPESQAIAEISARTTLIRAAIDSIRIDLVQLGSGDVDRSGADAVWAKEYRAMCVAKYGVLVPHDTNKRQSIPIEEIYVPGRLIGKSSLTVLDLAERLDRHVILGDPGGGKSTATTAIAHKIASTSSDQLPIVVILRNYAPKMGEESFAQFIERTIAADHETSAPPAGAIERMLRRGEATVLLDGLDELLDPTKRRALAEKIELFSKNYPATPMLVTSRRVGYSEAQLDPSSFESLELSSHTEDDIKEYATKWFNINSSELNLTGSVTVDDVVSAFLDESMTISDLRSNPLLLSLLCIIYRGQNYLPRHRIEIYEKCAELLFETWDRSRGLRFDFGFNSLIDVALKHLAYWMLTNDEQQAGVTEADLVKEIASFFTNNAYESSEKSLAAAREFIGFCKGRAWVLSETGLSPDGERLFTFAHRTFLEYYAAAQLTRKHPDPEKLSVQLVKRVSKNEWDTVGQLAIHLINRAVDRGAERSILKLLSSARAANRTLAYRTNVILFVVRTLSDLPPSPGLQRAAFQALSRLVEGYFHRRDEQNGSEWLMSQAFQTLVDLDSMGEEIVASELDTFILEANTRDETSQVAAQWVAGSCLRGGSSQVKEIFLREFIKIPNSDKDVFFDAILTGYFGQVLSIEEIVNISAERGFGIMEIFFADTSKFEITQASFQYFAAHTLASFAHLLTQDLLDERAESESNWMGTLAEQIGMILEAGELRSLIQQRELRLESVHWGTRHVRREPVELSPAQTLAVLVASCLLVELVARTEGVPPLEALRDGNPVALRDAAGAYVDGHWAPGSSVEQVADDETRAALIEWAAQQRSFVVSDSPTPSAV